MKRLINKLKHQTPISIDDSERGATMVEYALLVALLAVGSIGAVDSLAEGVSDSFDTSVTKMVAGGVLPPVGVGPLPG